MKRLIVGRADDCDIIISDSTDTISRHHLVISINFFGKMTISDTSANGTTINGKPLTKGVTLPVKRSDIVRLGNVADLDWDRISDPYSSRRKTTLAFLLLLCVGIGAGAWLYITDSKKDIQQPLIPAISASDTIPSDWNKDSTLSVAPVATSIEIDDNKGLEKKDEKKSLKSSNSSSQSRKKPAAKRVNKNKAPKSSPMMPKHMAEKHEVHRTSNSENYQMRKAENLGEKE